MKIVRIQTLIVAFRNKVLRIGIQWAMKNVSFFQKKIRITVQDVRVFFFHTGANETACNARAVDVHRENT